MKLHLGCGLKKIEGYVNIDIRPDVNPDIIDDIYKLNKIPNNSVDVIYACHVLEHFGRHEYLNVLKRWFEILKEDGILRISVPNFQSVNEYYNDTKDLSKLMGFLYGGQTYKENFHYYIWDFNSLKNDLISINFKEVNHFDWRKTEHSNIDDFSQAYLPHMDKENGKLMSLNVEAKK
jgi:SAM-dependent methyltransferase